MTVCLPSQRGYATMMTVQHRGQQLPDTPGQFSEADWWHPVRRGIPRTVEDRMAVIRRVPAETYRRGLPDSHLYADPLAK